MSTHHDCICGFFQNEYDEYFGRINDCTTSSRIEGPCGDDMEFYILIDDNVIDEVKYFTEKGCSDTRLAGRFVAKKAEGQNIFDALSINPAEIIQEEKDLSENGRHCAILAVTTFYRAIALYLLDH